MTDDRRRRLERAIHHSQERVYHHREGPVHYIEPTPDYPRAGSYGPRYEGPGMEIEEPRKQVLAAMGVPYKKGNIIPKEAEGTATIEGITFKLHKHVPRGMASRPWGRPGLRPIKIAKHRLYATCPICGKDIPVGRIAQHAVVHGVGEPYYMAAYERQKRRTVGRRSR